MTKLPACRGIANFDDIIPLHDVFDLLTIYYNGGWEVFSQVDNGPY